MRDIRTQQPQFGSMQWSNQQQQHTHTKQNALFNASVTERCELVLSHTITQESQHSPRVMHTPPSRHQRRQPHGSDRLGIHRVLWLLPHPPPLKAMQPKMKASGLVSGWLLAVSRGELGAHFAQPTILILCTEVPLMHLPKSMSHSMFAPFEIAII